MTKREVGGLHKHGGLARVLEKVRNGEAEADDSVGYYTVKYYDEGELPPTAYAAKNRGVGVLHGPSHGTTASTLIDIREKFCLENNYTMQVYNMKEKWDA